jgi:FkbM family methyltransferase
MEKKMIGSNFFSKVKRWLGQFNCIVLLSIKVRNQLNSIIHYHLFDGREMMDNGEAMLIEKISPSCYTVVDVGANIGYWLEFFIEKMPEERQAYAYEPSNSAFDKLCERFKTVKEVKLFNKAVSDEIGEISFFEEPECGETSSIFAGVSMTCANEVKTSVTTLDYEFFENQHVQMIDFLKIDVEGADGHVINGCQQLLAAGKIGVIQFEYNTSWMLADSTLHGTMSLLKSHNYKVYLLKKGGLYHFDYETYKEYFAYSNFVAVSSSFEHKVRDLIKGTI